VLRRLVRSQGTLRSELCEVEDILVKTVRVQKGKDEASTYPFGAIFFFSRKVGVFLSEAVLYICRIVRVSRHLCGRSVGDPEGRSNRIQWDPHQFTWWEKQKKKVDHQLNGVPHGECLDRPNLMAPTPVHTTSW
jgi:hypothetical protein